MEPISLFTEASDGKVRENFKRLQDFIKDLVAQPFLKGTFKFLTFSHDTAESNIKVPHGLGFKPEDVVVTSAIGSLSYTLNYSSFDENFLDITTTGSGTLTLRMFAGKAS